MLDKLLSIFNQTPRQIPNNAGELIDHLVRPAGSQFGGVENSYDGHLGLLKICLEAGTIRQETSEELAPGVEFILSGKSICSYFCSPMPQGVSGFEGVLYWKDLSPSEKARAFVKAGHSDQTNQVFCPDLGSKPTDKIRFVVGPKTISWEDPTNPVITDETLILWTIYAGAHFAHSKVVIESLDDCVPMTVVKGC